MFEVSVDSGAAFVKPLARVSYATNPAGKSKEPTVTSFPFVLADDSNAAEPLATLLQRLVPGIGDIGKDLIGAQWGVSNPQAKKVLGWQPRYSWREAS